MSRPQRSTRDGQAYLDLRKLARRDGRLTDELLQIYALEGFLGRLVTSESAGQLVLKGGVPFHVDVNVGDPVWPAPRLMELPCLLGGSIKLLGFPLAMVFAEKLITALQRHTTNTRWRDFADVYLLCGRHTVSGDELSQAISEVPAFRGMRLVPLSQALAGFAELSEARWQAWRHKLQLQDHLPESFATVLAAVTDFADPVMTRSAIGKVWSPQVKEWTTA